MFQTPFLKVGNSLRRTLRRAGAFIGLAVFAAVTLAAAPAFDQGEYAARRQKLMAKIPDGVAVIFGAQTLAGYTSFFQSNDFMYLCGVEIPNAVLIVDGIRKSSTLFFTISESEASTEGISPAFLKDPKKESGLEAVLPAERFDATLAGLAARTKVLYAPFSPEELARECSLEKLRTYQRTMVFDAWDGRQTRELQAVKHLKERFPGVEVRDLSPFVWGLRMIKTPAEIELMRKAARIAVRVYPEVMKATRPGMREYEIAALFEYLCKKEGCQDLAYYVIVRSGENLGSGHEHKNMRVLQDGEVMVIDAGPRLDYYNIDIQVTYPVNGKFTPRQKEIYEAVNALHEANMKVYRPGLTVDQCQSEVETILKGKGFDLTKEHFARLKGGFGHYIGLAVHDVLGGPTVLQPGMVMVNEPGYVSRTERVGASVEDTILITDTGCENLTAGLPRTVEEIEAVMRKGANPPPPKKSGLK